MGEFWSELLGSVASLFNRWLQDHRAKTWALFSGDDLAGQPSFGQMSFGSVNSDLSMLPDIADATPAREAPPMYVQAKAQLESLQKADPNFLESAFLSLASKTYSAALAAEGAMSPDSVVDLVTPAFLDHFRQRVESWKSGGFSRVVSDVALDAPTAFKVAIGGENQSITVRFTGTAKRFTKEDMTNLVTDGSAQGQSFTEFATFVRPANSTTPKSETESGQTHCPSCGAPAPDGAMQCIFCGACLTGSGGAWKLDKTSASAYT